MPDAKIEAEHGEYVVEAGAYSTQDGAGRRVDTALTRAMPAAEEVKEAAPSVPARVRLTRWWMQAAV
jgi:hypothetical protein